MNRKQIAAMWVGIVFVLAVCIYPPGHYNTPGGGYCYEFGDCRWWQSPIFFGQTNIDPANMKIELFIIAVITAAFIVTFKDKKHQ